VALQAAWERASRAGGKKCVRGVVDERKLMPDNPWKHFPWIEGYERPIRQFDGDELLSLLAYLEQKWAGVTVAPLLAKVLLWSSARRSEVVGLNWEQLREVGTEKHFHVVGKWGVRKWFRVPDGLYEELLAVRTGSRYVFAAYTAQLRRFYEGSTRPGAAKMVNDDFNPTCLGDWFHERLVDWSKTLPKGRAYTHVFRKTSLQYARRGDDASRRVAEDAHVSESVLMKHYVEESDPERREASNRIYQRILASLPADVACRYGHVQAAPDSLEQHLRTACEAKDWPLVADLSARLAAQKPRPAG
jgi:integrase